MVEETRPLSVVDPPQGDLPFIRAMQNQLLIALVNRLGGSLTMPVDEVDCTAAFNLLMGADDVARTFTFRVVRKEG